MDLATLATCTDLTTEHAKQAASSAAELRKLLARVVAIARPNEGCPKVLMAVARLVGQEWVEGELRVELSGDDASTTLVIICEFGEGIRERLVPAARFPVPIDEFERALELSPKLVLPLKITDEVGKLVLTPLGAGEPRKAAAVPKLEIDEQSLGEQERKTAPPPANELQVIDEAVPAEAGPAALDGELDFGERKDSVPVGNPAAAPKIGNVHTRPTVRMVAVDPAALAAAMKRGDPRRDED